MAFETRHRDKNGEISRKHGSTRIRTLRKTYGPGFAGGCADHAQRRDPSDGHRSQNRARSTTIAAIRPW